MKKLNISPFEKQNKKALEILEKEVRPQIKIYEEQKNITNKERNQQL